MSLRTLLMHSTVLFAFAFAFAGAAWAQSAPQATLPPGSDSWSKPAAASTAANAYGASTTSHKDGENSHFKFKESRQAKPERNAALEAAGKAPVMGGGQMGRDGRPTVSCAATPMDPACR